MIIRIHIVSWTTEIFSGFTIIFCSEISPNVKQFLFWRLLPIFKEDKPKWYFYVLETTDGRSFRIWKVDYNNRMTQSLLSFWEFKYSTYFQEQRVVKLSLAFFRISIFSTWQSHDLQQQWCFKIGQILIFPCKKHPSSICQHHLPLPVKPIQSLTTSWVE